NMKKFNRLIAFIIIQSLLLVNICFAGNVFIKEIELKTKVSTLSPQLSINIPGFINAMYSARVAQEKEFKTPEFLSDVSPEEFKTRLFKNPDYGNNWIFMDFEQTLVKENISAAFALRSIKRAFTNEPNIFKKPFVFMGRFFKVLYLYYQWKTTKSIEAGIATFEGITKEDVQGFAQSLTLNETALDMLKQLNAIMGKQKQHVVIISRSTQDLLKAFFAREDIVKALSENHIQVPYVCSNVSLLENNRVTGIKDSQYNISASTKRLYLFESNLYIADNVERDVREDGIKAFFVEDFAGLTFEHVVYTRLYTEYLQLKDSRKVPITRQNGLKEEVNQSADVIKGTRNSLYVKQKAFKEMIEGIEDGTEIQFAASGGGGDTLGTIFLIKILKRMFMLQGKKNIKFKIIFPTIKYGKENPFGGDIKIEQVKGITPIAIEGEAQAHFYTISAELKARIPIEDNNGNQLIMNGKPVFYERQWSEGNIIDLAQKDEIELIMMDMDQKASDLKRQYLAMNKEKKVVTFYGDMGGDSFAQIPGKITDNNHTEVAIASPVSDLTGLIIFDGPAWILALGGDGESLERTQRTHVTTLFEKGQIAGLFDTEDYLRQSYADGNDSIDILAQMDEYSKRFSSEVSKNLFRRHKQVSLDHDMQSVIKKYGPWDYADLLRTDERIEPTTLRYEKREEYLSRYYLSALVVDSTQSMRNNVQTKEILREDITWSEREQLLRKLNYATEGLSYVVYRSKIKNFSNMFLEMLRKGETSSKELSGLFFSDDFSIELRLAAVQAIYRNFHFINGGEKLTREIGSKLMDMMQDKQNNVFLVAEIAKTVGIIGFEDAIDLLHDFLENPKAYGDWPFFNLYFYPYAKRRIIDTAERSLRMLIEKVLARDGAQKAWVIFNKVNGTHPLFKDLGDRISLKLDTDRINAALGKTDFPQMHFAFEVITQAI
ncbi:MAG: hypothetical protein V1739_08925, partial [Candidatus Omnitrophota bacterium]